MKKGLFIALLLTVLSVTALVVNIADTILYSHTHRLLQIATTIISIGLAPFAAGAWREHIKKP